MTTNLVWLTLSAVISATTQAQGPPLPGLAADGSIDNTIPAVGTALAPAGQLGHVERRGTGRTTLILVPGAGFGWRVWDDFMRRNADRFTMYAITPPGYDGTPAWPMPTARRPNGVPDYAKREWSDVLVDAVATLIRRERIDRPIIVGHHVIGDYVAIRLAADPRVAARGLVIIGGSPPAFGLPPNADPSRPGVRDSLARDVFVHGPQASFFRTVTPEAWRTGAFPAGALSWQPDVAERLKAEQLSTPLPIQIRYYLEYMSADASAQYAALDIPVLLIPARVPFERASQQMRTMLLARTGSDSAARRVYQAIIQGYPTPQPRGITTTHIAETGVFVMLDKPRELDAAIAGFAESIR